MEYTYSISSYNYPKRYILHRKFLGYVESIYIDNEVEKNASFRLVNGLANSGCTSFESINLSGHYLRHENYRIKLAKNNGSELFKQDATFCQRAGNAGSGCSFESHKFPGYFIRHKNYKLWIDPSDGSDLFKKDSTFQIVEALHNSL